MNPRHFASFSRVTATAGSRRWLLALLATLPVLGGFQENLSPDDAEGQSRRKQRRKRRKKRRKRQRVNTCAQCTGCGDSSGVCQPGTTNAACGSSGTCDTCAEREQCQGQTCVCVPDCAGKCSGAADGCGGTCTGGCAGGRICLDNGTCAVPCPGGGSDCAVAGCEFARCITTGQGKVCSLGEAEGDCSDDDNAQCPTGRACAGSLCENVC